MVESLEYLDFSKEELLKEYFWIGWYSKGGFTFKDVSKMSFNEYEMVLKEAMEIQKREKESMKVDNG